MIVGFEHNHPDKPFVMGGMFHSGTALGGLVNNHMRSIQTKSGIKVLMNDNEKSVTILDPSGNTYFMDGAGNIEVTAPNNMTFTAGKNMNINVGENMTTSVGMNQSDTIGMNKSTNVTANHSESVGAMKMTSVVGDASMFITGKLTEIIDGDVHSEAKQERNEIGKKEMSITSEGILNNYTKDTLYLNSGEKSNNF